MGRQKKHTAASLKKGVAAYFRKITYDQPMVKRMPEVNEFGEVVFKNRLAVDDYGRPITKKAWMATPSIADLALHLGVHRSTLWEYRKDPELGPIVESAKSWTEAYWTEQLGEDNKGAKFALEAGMGWGERWTSKVDVVHDMGMTLEEFLRSQGEGSA